MNPPRLELEATAPTEPSARLLDFVWSGAAPDLSLHGMGGGGWWLARTRLLDGPDGTAVRWVENFEVDHGEAVPRDRARWDVDPSRFAETGRWQGDGPNLHRRATVLPAVMKVGEGALPIPGARITLAWVGPARLSSAGREVEWRCARLLIEQGTVRMEQWLAEGVGEIAIGAAWGPFGRWLVGWEGGDRQLFGGVPSPWRELALPTLDEEEEGAPVRGISG